MRGGYNLKRITVKSIVMKTCPKLSIDGSCIPWFVIMQDDVLIYDWSNSRTDITANKMEQTQVCMCVCVCVCVCVCLCECMDMYLSYICVCVCVCMYIYYACMRVYIYIYIYIYMTGQTAERT